MGVKTPLGAKLSRFYLPTPFGKGQARGETCGEKVALCCLAVTLSTPRRSPGQASCSAVGRRRVSLQADNEDVYKDGPRREIRLVLISMDLPPGALWEKAQIMTKYLNFGRSTRLAGALLCVLMLAGWVHPASLDKARAGATLPVRSSDDEAAAGLGVNSFLWRASLDTVSFMPLTTVDSVGGVIITDWRSNPRVPEERFKMTVYVLDKRLRADGVKVAVFRQVRSGPNWIDAAANPETATSLENAILTRARQYKFNASTR